jgi:flagellar biosynthesis/type III secretory pathway M-ring protein FliF/YscJ
MEFLIFLAVLAVVVVFVTRPLWRPLTQATEPEAAPAKATELADLEAARDAKFREIRDAELDHRTGKLSHEDFERIDRSLRAEAVQILRDLDRAGEAPAQSGGRQTDARVTRVVSSAQRLPSR